MESLEGRVVLSGMADLAVAEPEPDTSVELAEVAPCLASSVIDGDPAGNVPADQAPPGGNGGPNDPQDPGAPLLPPRITDFVAYVEKGILCVSGFVVDDKEVGGLTVRFGGEIDGQSASVDPDGFFELMLGVPSGFGGMVYAQTTDTDGLDSELVSKYVH
jgi:hypothetical protein